MSPEIHVPRLSRKPRMAAACLGSLPAEVLMDRYNPKWDHLWPTRQMRVDVWRLYKADGWAYGWIRSDLREVLDR